MPSLFSIACLIGLAVSPISALSIVGHAPHARLVSRAAGDEKVTLQIGLKMRNLEQLEPKLRAASDPASPSYGEYMEARDVRKLFFRRRTRRDR